MECAVPMSKIVMKNWRESVMAFKCEEVDEKFRKQIEEENGIFTGIKEISSWMIDEERGIVVWMQPSTKKR